MKCQSCGSSDVYTSLRHQHEAGFLRKMIRCHRCRVLFSAWSWAAVPKTAADFDMSPKPSAILPTAHTVTSFRVSGDSTDTRTLARMALSDSHETIASRARAAKEVSVE